MRRMHHGGRLGRNADCYSPTLAAASFAGRGTVANTPKPVGRSHPRVGQSLSGFPAGACTKHWQNRQ